MYGYIYILLYIGREFQVVLMSTTEPTHTDGSTRNPTRSLCDPYVFNTAVTRAKSLVVAVGNPFLLLSMERQIIKHYGNKGNCWSTYLKLCMKHRTLEFTDTFSKEEQTHHKEQLQQYLQEVNPEPEESKEKAAMKKEIEELKACIRRMNQTPSNVAPLANVLSPEVSPSHARTLQGTPVSPLSQSQNSPQDVTLRNNISLPGNYFFKLKYFHLHILQIIVKQELIWLATPF